MRYFHCCTMSVTIMQHNHHALVSWYSYTATTIVTDNGVSSLPLCLIFAGNRQLQYTIEVVERHLRAFHLPQFCLSTCMFLGQVQEEGEKERQRELTQELLGLS